MVDVQSFTAKFQAAALKASSQAQSFGKAVAAEAQSQGQKTMTGFKLENEVRHRWIVGDTTGPVRHLLKSVCLVC